MVLSQTERKRLQSKYGEWAIVTGASSGIGLELATQLALAGFNLIINARDSQRINKVENDLKSKANIQIKAVAADLSESNGVEKIIEASHNLNIGLLINNAGFGTSGLFTDS